MRVNAATGRTPKHAAVRASHSVRATILGACALPMMGTLVPQIHYDLRIAIAFLALFAAGAIALNLLAGARRRTMVWAYGTFVTLAAITCVFATNYAAHYGLLSPIWLIDRFATNPLRDDARVWELAIRPAIGKPDVHLMTWTTNAPLHWYANVRLQEVMVAFTGREVPLAMIAINIVMGGLAAGFIVGAIDATFPESNVEEPKVRNRAYRLAFTCPWLLASSVIAIREIWVHAVFAAALFFGFAYRRRRGMSKDAAMVIVAAVLAFACYLLRPEMAAIVVASLLIASYGTPEGDRRPRWVRVAAFGAVAVIWMTVRQFTVLDEASDAFLRRSAQYAVASNASDVGVYDRGIVKAVAGGQGALWYLVQLAWLWIKPLPKVHLVRGSLYAAGMLCNAIWIVWMAYYVVRIRRLATGSTRPRTHPNFRLLSWWIGVFTVLVALTSGEVRHIYNALPAIIVIAANVIGECGSDLHLRRVARSARVVMAGIVLGCIVITFAVWGGIDV